MKENHVAIKVWDLPVRLFHWVVTALLILQWVTGKIGGDLMGYHVYCGYTILSLVIFRILWGFTGSTHSRFASFFAGPVATFRFARRLFSREAVPQVGHNPLGGWMVIALIVSLLLQAGSGLFANDGVATAGPLANLIGLEASNKVSDFHDANFKVLLALATIHVCAVFYHLIFKRENLTPAMFTGVKEVPESLLRHRREANRDTPPRRVASRESAIAEFPSAWHSVALLALSIALVVTLVVVGSN